MKVRVRVRLVSCGVGQFDERVILDYPATRISRSSFLFLSCNRTDCPHSIYVSSISLSIGVECKIKYLCETSRSFSRPCYIVGNQRWLQPKINNIVRKADVLLLYHPALKTVFLELNEDFVFT